MMGQSEIAVIRQHLIDPEICIRCNTCEATCPVGAVTHDSRNYVVDASKCNRCMACIAPCPTGSIDSWRTVRSVDAYSIEAQLGWDELPPELESLDSLGIGSHVPAASAPESPMPAGIEPASKTNSYSASVSPWSAAQASTNLYGPNAPEPFVTAIVSG